MTDAAVQQEVLVFTLGEQQYALPISHVQQILPLSTWTPVPKSPPYLKGLTNYRNQVLPVYDLAMALGVEASSEPKLIVVDRSISGLQGYLVTSVLDVRTVGDAKVIDSTVQEHMGGVRTVSTLQIEPQEPYVILLDS